MAQLQNGSKGAEVYALQLALLCGGFLKEKPDGVFGARTADAVRRVQQQFGIRPDGVVAEQTWQALERWLAGYITHTVVRGDTFFKLAQTYGTSVRAIRTANPSVDPLNLQIGTRLTIPLGFDLVPTDIPYSSLLVRALVRGLKMRYPFLRTGSIGKSVMGRDLSLLSIGEGNKRVFYSAAIHANEWITAPVLLRFIEEYAYQYAVGGAVSFVKAADLYREVTIDFVPMVNPDGVDLVTGALTGGSSYERAVSFARRYPAVPFPSGWKANINGVDLNLQFPALWQEARELKFAAGWTAPSPREYVGTAPLTEPEAQSLAFFTQSSDFALILAYHTQGNIIYWKFDGYEPERSREIGEILSRVSGYPLTLTPENQAYAGYKDWFIQTYDLPGYTVECGKGVNPLPLTQFDDIYKANVGLLVAAAMEA